jgi:pyridoxamine 5'-phosphate oxidase
MLSLTTRHKRIIAPQPEKESDMDLQDCIKFAKENPMCAVSTIDGDQPRVRTLQLDWADETGFYFGIFSPKEISRQLHVNPKVEVCFYNHAEQLMETRQMRITAEVEFVDDEESVNRAYKLRAALEPMAGRPLKPLTEVFRISHGEARFWTIPDSLKEPRLERIRF